MHTHVDNKNKSKSIATVESKSLKNDAATFQFVNNRAESITQEELQKMANNSEQVSQLSAFQNMVDSKTANEQIPIQRKENNKENNKGLPDNLKTGKENISGLSLNDMKVPCNSDKPAQLQADTYTQGTEIYLGAHQEQHLSHKALHVVQQKQERVKSTKELNGNMNLDDDARLEQKANVLETATHQLKEDNTADGNATKNGNKESDSVQLKPNDTVVQREIGTVSKQEEESPQQKFERKKLETTEFNQSKKGELQAELAAMNGSGKVKEAAAEGGELDRHIKKKGDQTKLIGVKGGQGRAAELSGAAEVQNQLGLKDGDRTKGIKESFEKLDSTLESFLAFDKSSSASVLAEAANGGLSDKAKWNVILINSEFMSLIEPGLSINKIIPDNKVNNIVTTGNMNASKPEDLASAWDNALGGSVADSTNYDDGLKGSEAIANFGLDYGGYEEIDDQGKVHPLYKGKKIADIDASDSDHEAVDKGWTGLSPYVKEVSRDESGHAKLDAISNVFYVKVQVPEKEFDKIKVPLHGSIHEYASKMNTKIETLLSGSNLGQKEKVEAIAKKKILTRFLKYAKVDDGMTVSSLSDGKTKNIEDPLTNLGITKPGSRLKTQYGTINQEYHLAEVIPVGVDSGLWLKDATGKDIQVASCYKKEGKVLFKILPENQDKMNAALAENKSFHA